VILMAETLVACSLLVLSLAALAETFRRAREETEKRRSTRRNS
jgi:hypothetical protein